MSSIRYFAACSTLDALKAEYKRLAKLHHPDCGGSDEIMAAINAEYLRQPILRKREAYD